MGPFIHMGKGVRLYTRMSLEISEVFPGWLLSVSMCREKFQEGSYGKKAVSIESSHRRLGN